MAGDQPVETWVAAQRREVGIDPQPAGGEVVGNLQQPFKLVQRLLRLSREHVDPRELMVEVGPNVCVLANRQQRYAVLSLAYRIWPPSHKGQRETQGDVLPGIAWRREARGQIGRAHV